MADASACRIGHDGQPTLVIHGNADAIVPIEGSGQRTHRAVPHCDLVVVQGAPHGLNVSHAQAFNEALLSFLQIGRDPRWPLNLERRDRKRPGA
jgi:pimeloyl-ACP methyl ester carboxylesterase